MKNFLLKNPSEKKILILPIVHIQTLQMNKNNDKILLALVDLMIYVLTFLLIKDYVAF